MTPTTSLVRVPLDVGGALRAAAQLIAKGHATDAIKARRGHLYALAATLRDSAALTAPPERLCAPLKADAAALPPQYSGSDHENPFWQWIMIAALTENDGDLALAGIMVTQLLAQVSALPASTEQREHIAICLARRGRLARQAGELDDAEEHFNHAQRLVRRASSPDAWAQAQLGLAVVAALRGNYPLCEQRINRVVSAKTHMHALYRSGAYQTLSNISRRRGQYIDALLSGWRAYDMIDRDDVRRTEVVNALSEIALEAGEIDAARVGFESICAKGGPERVAVPATIGLFHVAKQRASQARNTNELEQAKDEIREATVNLENLFARAIQPHERVNLQINIGDAYMQLGEFDKAAEHLNEAVLHATERKFHSFSFAAESLLETLKKKSRETQPLRPSITRIQATTTSASDRHPAVKRLFALAAH